MKYCHQVLNTMKKRKAPNGAFFVFIWSSHYSEVSFALPLAIKTILSTILTM